MLRRWRTTLACSFLLMAASGVPAAAATRASASALVADHVMVRIAVVIDFGPGSGLSRRVVIRCFNVPAGSNGTDVLADLAASAKVEAPTYADSGLLCSIDGFPGGGCGTPSGGGVTYWSYWHGGSSWSYASVGPAEWTASDGDVEGWRFDTASAGTGVDPPPAAPASYAAACATTGDASFPVTEPVASPSSTSTLVAAIAGIVVIGLAAESARRWRRRVP